MKVLVPQLCPTLCNSMDCRHPRSPPPGSSVHGILQARILGWVAIPFSSKSTMPQYKIKIKFFKFKFIYFNWRLIILQYCIGSATHQHESATGAHMSPSRTPLPPPHPHTIPPGHPSAPAPSILYQTWTGDSFLI